MICTIITIFDSKNNQQIFHLNEERQKQYIIGRSIDADCFIDDEVISKFHGILKFEDGELWYKDNYSSNGTYLEQYGVKSFIKNDSGSFRLHYPSILRIGNYKDSNRMVLIMIQKQKEGEAWTKYELTSDSTTIGRGSFNEITLNHPSISLKHCSIIRKNGHYFLEHIHSTNGLFLNGEQFQGKQELNDKDVISILDYQMVFTCGYLYYRKEKEGISLTASHIYKTVGRGKRKKRILNNVNCEINSNEFVAIIGGSGAGKTTLMNALSGFYPDFDGHVYCNGIDLISQFASLKGMIGFVPQQDIIYENFMLRKMLQYTAKLKMPPDTTKFEREKRIDEVLQMMNLSSHQHTLIKKLSGGQKKRASIAVELLADPKLFFLDEPTSGLDPGTERSIMHLLQKLSKEQNKTVIMVTHTTVNLHLCDKIIFMNPKGCLSFCGNESEALRFFHTKDLVDIYTMLEERPDYWHDKFASSIQSIPLESPLKSKIVIEESKVNGLRQFHILTTRYAHLILRDKQRLTILLLQPIAIAILLYLVADKNVFSIYDSTKSILFALDCSAIWIGLFNTIQEICKERVIVLREYMSNLKLSCYILSKITVHSVLGLIQAALLSQLFLIFMNHDLPGIFFKHFNFEIFLTVWLTILAAASLGLVISAIAKSGDKAMTIAPFTLIIQLLFSGILFTLKGVGNWISFGTISRWSVEGLGSIVNLNNMKLSIQEEIPAAVHEAETLFEGTKEHLLTTWGILMLMCSICLLLCRLLLNNMKNKR